MMTGNIQPNQGQCIFLVFNVFIDIISQVSFNPQDNTQLCVVGNGIMKNYRYSEGNLKTFNIQKVEPQNYLCHAWVSEERVIVGTDSGRLMLFEAGEMKHEFNIAAQEKEK